MIDYQIREKLARMHVVGVELLRSPMGCTVMVRDSNARCKDENMMDIAFGAGDIFIKTRPRSPWVELFAGVNYELAQEWYEAALVQYELNRAPPPPMFKDLKPGDRFRFARVRRGEDVGIFTVCESNGKSRALSDCFCVTTPLPECHIDRVLTVSEAMGRLPITFKDLELGEYFRVDAGSNAQFMVVHKNGGRCARAADLTITYPSPRSSVIRTYPQLLFKDLKAGDRFQFTGEYNKEFTAVRHGRKPKLHVLNTRTSVVWTTRGDRPVTRIEPKQ